jgi:tetratricopeptide (TPR) repeat protein
MYRIKLLALIFIIFFISNNKLVFSNNVSDEWDKAEQAFRKLIPKIPEIANKYPNDLKIQLGAVFLYDKYGTPVDISSIEPYKVVNEHRQAFLAQCRRVLQIDPNNKPVHSVLARTRCLQFVGMRTMQMDYLEGLISNAKKRNAEEIEIPTDDPLREWFSGTDKCVSGKNPYGAKDGVPYYYLVINKKDYDLARKQLQGKFDADAPIVLAEINSHQEKDPDNAFYNYIKAHYYFQLGNKTQGLMEVEEAVTKRYFSTFQEEIIDGEEKVLLELDFPKKYRNFIISIRSPFEDFINWNIWKEGLSPIVEDYESNGDIENAEKICKLTIEAAQQVQKDNPYKPLGLDKAIQKRINKLHNIPDAIEKEHQTVTKKPLGFVYPATVGLALVVLAAGGILLYKKRTKPHQP